MKKYKIYYPDKKYNENDNILFLNFYTKEHMNIMQNYSNKTILYNSKEIFFNNLDKIKQIIYKKKNIISFDGDIQMIINKIKNRPKEILGVLSDTKNIQCISELEKVYEIEYSSDSQYFHNKDIPLCIINIQNNPEYNKLLENRISQNILKKIYIIHQNCNDILYRLFINNYWDENINFINIYKNCYFSNRIPLYTKNAICNKYGLSEKINEPLIYFGDCNEDDYDKIKNYSNIVFIIWMSVEPRNKKIKKILKILNKKNNIFHFGINKSLMKNLREYNVTPRLFPINITKDSSIFKPVLKKGSKILLSRSQKFHQELKEILPEYDFIFCNKFNLNDPIIAEQLYRKCFIVLRLTKYDGYLEMVDQLQAMNIPIVHNSSKYGLKWNNINDIKDHILKYSPPIVNYKHQYSFDLLKDKLNNEHLDMIYKNLDEIREIFNKYTNILFISNQEDDYKIFKEFIGKDNINSESPELIIVKGNCVIDIYKYNSAYTILLLDKPSYKNINNFDIIFVNSQHIIENLKKLGISCKLFYWDFIPYYGKSIIMNNNRKYDFGVVKYSNIPDIIISKKHNIIIEDYSVLRKHLHEIKYIIYNSKYEITCQMRVDAIMNNVNCNIPKYVTLGKNKRLKFKKGGEYIIGFDGYVITEKLVNGICFIEGVNDKELIIYYKAENDLEIDELEFIKKQKINNEIYGYNPCYLKSIDLEYLYYIYGYIDNGTILDKLGVSNIFNYYSTELLTKKYNVELLKRKWCYDLGKKGDKLDLVNFANFILNYPDNIICKKCLVISKKINGSGGNQKTALQIIQLLEKKFIVEVFSNNMNQKEYCLIKDSLDCRIHNMKIIKKKKDDEIIRYINDNQYEFIMNNKYNDYFRICDKIIHPKLYVISHNSMDPFNELIIKNQNYITKVFTINKFHQKVLQYHGFKKPQEIFYNYVEKEINEEKREKFKKRIAFIGRMTKEKNLDLLTSAMKHLNWLELVIIGGENNTGIFHKNIIWKGFLQKDEIICELRRCDYLVVPSSTEGLPFVILEAMNIGIPCIYSRIIGADELIGEEGERGFTFELRGYKKCIMKMDWSVFKEVDAHFEENIYNIQECIRDAYNISIKDWNKISNNCKKFIKNNYFDYITEIKNLKSMEIFL